MFRIDALHNQAQSRTANVGVLPLGSGRLGPYELVALQLCVGLHVNLLQYLGEWTNCPRVAAEVTCWVSVGATKPRSVRQKMAYSDRWATHWIMHTKG